MQLHPHYDDHPKKVDSLDDHDSEDEVAIVNNEIADFMASKKVGYGQDMPDKIQAICDYLDIKVHEEEVQKISTTIFVTNFPDHAKAKDLWNVCKQYGQVVVDAFIPDRKSKAGKRFLVGAKETTGWIPDFYEQEEDNSKLEDEQSIGFIKENFDDSDVEKEGDNNVSMVPD
nr:ChaC-like family protein [Tanacetum cinerariifolium]